MSTIKKIFTSPFFIVALFALAAALLLLSGIGGARAALNSQSEVYSLNINAQHIRVAICENGKENDSLELSGVPTDLTEIKEEDEPYKEVLTVKNPYVTTEQGEKSYESVPEYVRVIVYRYWVNADTGEKISNDFLSPDMIELNFVEGAGWTIDSQTSERTIMSYSKVLQPDEETTPFVNGISFGTDLADYVKASDVKTEYIPDPETHTTTITTTSEYSFDVGVENSVKNVKFVVEAEAQAVQTHNYEEAMMSAWGYIPKNIIPAE